MANRPYPVITVNEKAARSLRAGHPWVYGAETSGPDRPCQNGDLVDVVSQKGRWLGTGLYNNHSKILVRLLSRNTNDRFDEGFWRRRLRYALDYRKTVMGPDYACCRLYCCCLLAQTRNLSGMCFQVCHTSLCGSHTAGDCTDCTL